MRRRLVQELTEQESLEVLALLNDELSATVEVAVKEIENRIPRYTHLHDPEHADLLPSTVSRSITGFFEILADREAPREDLRGFMRGVGVIEAKEGLTREMSRAAFRLGAGVAIQRLTEVAQRHPSVTPSIIGTVANALLGYLNDVERSVGEGHDDAFARQVGDLRRRRAALVDLLLDPEADYDEVSRHAHLVDWPLPRRVAAVALGRLHTACSAGLDLPPDVLVGHQRDRSCLVVPDPDGPGRHRMLHSGLRRWHAAVGPTVPLPDLRHSFDLACRSLDASVDGHDGPVMAVDHLPLLLLRHDPAATRTLIDARLGPLLNSDLGEDKATTLARTLLACLENDFNAVLVADLMHVHPQTVRYRMRNLAHIFGEGLRSPAHRLDLHLAVHAWLAQGDGAPTPKGLP